ncbi:MAG: lipopolysaccharide heptosyltransferase I [Neisseriaceae bacterium]
MVKILIIRLSSIGDIIHTFPMVYDIKNNIKDVCIDWVVDESFKDLLKYNKNVNNVITVPFRKWKKNKIKLIYNFRNWYKQLENKEYDFIIDSQGLIKSAILTRYFNGNVYGYDCSSAREKLASFLYKNKIKISKNVLATTKNRLLCQKIFNYNINLQHIDFGIEEYFKEENIKIVDYEYVIFFHAASKDEKKYPIENWINVANHILQNSKLKIILPYGNKKEKQESFEIKNKINSDRVIVPEKIYSFSEIYFLIYGASFIIGVDTGLIHLSNALNKKTIALYTNTDSKKTGIIETDISKNLGGIQLIPDYKEINLLFDKIMKA